jgi:hypothetical protein
MHTSVETYSAGTTTVKKMGTMLILAFVGAQLSAFGSFAAFLAAYVFAPNLAQEPFGTPIISGGIGMAILAVLLLSASFLALSLYPEHGKRQMAAGFLAVVVLVVGLMVISSIARLLRLDPYETTIPTQEVSLGIGIAFCLLVSGRIKGWRDLAGLGSGLAIGIGLRLTSLYIPLSFDFSSIWMSSVFFSELLSGRASWRAAGVGTLLWAGLIALSVLVTHVFHIF